MSLSLLSGPEDLIDDIEGKLRHGWILVLGNLDAIVSLENEVYTPGTPDNADFALYVLPGFPPRSLFIAKKTPKLKELMQWQKHELSQREWDLPFVLKLLALDNGHCLSEVTVFHGLKEAVHFTEAFVRGELSR